MQVGEPLAYYSVSRKRFPKKVVEKKGIPGEDEENELAGLSQLEDIAEREGA
jgi:hypothetical protein